MTWLKRNRSTLILVLILLIGLGLLLYPTVSDYWNSFHQSRVIVDYLSTVSDMDTEVYDQILKSAQDYILPVIGIVISVCGLLLETEADRQKSAQKKENPNMVATKGLYKIVRCPNYFGEIVFWTGVLIADLTALKTAGQWIVAVFAWIAIVYIMFNGAQRLEKRQNARYGEDPAYKDYVGKTPIILPGLPIYHLNKK